MNGRYIECKSWAFTNQNFVHQDYQYNLQMEEQQQP